MDFYNRTSSHVERAHRMFTREFTLHQFQFDTGAGNPYADNTWEELTASVQATLRSGDGEPDYEFDASGFAIEHSAVLFLQPDEVEIRFGDRDREKATQFSDPRSGRRYRAVETKYDDSLVAVALEEVES